MRTYNRIYRVIVLKFNYVEKQESTQANISKWPFLATQCVTYLRDRGVKVLATNAPSFDNETSSYLSNHHAFFSENLEHILIELVDVSNLESGAYIADIGIYPINTDAEPCILKMKKIITAKIDETTQNLLMEDSN
jgi:kynurenine formamidase